MFGSSTFRIPASALHPQADPGRYALASRLPGGYRPPTRDQREDGMDQPVRDLPTDHRPPGEWTPGELPPGLTRVPYWVYNDPRPPALNRSACSRVPPGISCAWRWTCP